MSIPKIIWALWCNFDKKTDGMLTDSIRYFKDRIIKLSIISKKLL